MKEMVLRPWQECIGYYNGIDEQEGVIVLKIMTDNDEIGLIFNRNSSEHLYLKDALANCREGQVIGILRTGLKNAVIVKFLD